MNFRSLLISIMCINFLSGLQAIDHSPSKPLSLRIVNTTDTTLELWITYKGGEPINLRFPSKMEFETQDTEALAALHIVPHGTIRGWIKTPAQRNWAVDAKAALYENKQDTLMIINPAAPTPSAESSLWQRAAAKIMQETLPYDITFAQLKTCTIIHHWDLVNSFPEVEKALHENRTIFPKYVFGLKEEATEREIKEAYRSLSALLKAKKETLVQAGFDPVYYIDALAFVDAAYKSALGIDTTTFAQIVNDDIKDAPMIYGEPRRIPSAAATAVS